MLFNKMKAKPDVMRPEIMHGLGISLVLKFPEMNERETTEEEETHIAGLNRYLLLALNRYIALLIGLNRF